MEVVFLTIYGNVSQRTDTVILHISFRRVEKFDYNREDADIREPPAATLWTQSVSHKSLSDPTAYPILTFATEHGWHYVESARPLNERAVPGE